MTSRTSTVGTDLSVSAETRPLTNMTAPTSESIAPLSTGERVHVPEIGDIRVGEVTCRNWSRVAPAVGPDGEELFCKQFVDRVGAIHVSGYAGELKTRERLSHDQLPDVEIVPVVGTVDDRLIMVSPRIDMMTIDSIPVARSIHREPALAVGAALEAILDTRRLPNDPSTVAVWKGIDPKNIGWDRDGKLWIFDFGPESELSITSAAGRLMAAGLLSRWVARPGPHLVWPERTILRGVCAPISRFTTYEEVDRRLVENHELRRREPQRTGARATATRLGVNSLGRVYWAHARREARRLFA